MERTKIDSETLIDTIKKYESIWNKHSKDYHKKSAKELAWNNVAEEFFDDWDEYDEDQKNAKQFELRKRWTNIRDYYKKDLALQMNDSIGESATKRKKYIFSQKLDFMRPIFEDSFKPEKKKDNDDDNQEEAEIYEYIDENYSTDSETFKPNKKPTLKFVTEKNFLEATPSKIDVVTSKHEEDSDYLFLKSLLPDMKMMNRRQKIDFKLGILQLYKNITDSDHNSDDDDSKNPLKIN